MRQTMNGVSRRTLIKVGLGSLGLLAPLAAACGAPPATPAAPTAAPQPTTAPAAAPTTAPAGAPTPTAAAAAKPAAAAGKVTVRFLHGREDVTGAALKTIVERFNAENPGVEVKIEVIGSLAAQTEKQTAQTLIGDPYEIFENPANRLVNFARDGKIADLEALNSSQGGFDPKQYWPALVEAMTWKGKLVGLPLGNAGQGFYSRPDLFQKAGLTPPPQTWAELEQIGPKLTAENRHAVGIQATELVWFKVLLHQRGGAIVDKAASKVTFNGPEGIESLQYLHDLINKHKIATVATGRDAFLAGTIATTTLGEWGVGELVAGKIPHLVSPYPRLKEGADPISPGGYDALTVFKTAPEKEQAAWKFLTWMVKPEIHFAYWVAPPVSRSPISPAELELPAFKEAVKQNSGIATFSQQLPHIFRDPPVLTVGRDIDKALELAQEAVVLGKKTPKEALTEAAEQATTLLAKEPR
jgi:ABC-type glycerol-3-phosphate transport system substrate-binding protein